MNQNTTVSAMLITGFISVAALFVTCESSQPAGKRIAAAEVFNIVNDSIKVNEYLVLDLRARLDYVRGHLVSAMWMPIDSLPKYMHFVENEKRPIILYGDDGVETVSADSLFSAHGVTNYYVLEHGFSKWLKKGYPAAIQLVMNTSDRVDGKALPMMPDALQAFVEQDSTALAIIDLRTVREYKEIHIEHALSIPYVPINEFVVKVEEQNFPRDKMIVVYSDTNAPDIVMKATDVLLRNYYTNVHFLEGGLESWYRKKYPTAY